MLAARFEPPRSAFLRGADGFRTAVASRFAGASRRNTCALQFALDELSLPGVEPQGGTDPCSKVPVATLCDWR